jgi:hypothetical protein
MPAVTLRKLLQSVTASGQIGGNTTGTVPTGSSSSSGVLGAPGGVEQYITRGQLVKTLPGQAKANPFDNSVKDSPKASPITGVWDRTYTDWTQDQNGEWQPMTRYWDQWTPNDDPFRDSTPRSDVRTNIPTSQLGTSMAVRQQKLNQFVARTSTPGTTTRITARSRS